MLEKFSEFINEAEIQKISRLKPEILNLLNKQIENELYSSQLYRAMSCWLDYNGWIGGSNLFFKYADEELEHTNKIYKYLFLKNTKPIVPSVNITMNDYMDVRSLLESALEHEMKVTAQWNNIALKSKELNDNDTYIIAQDYVKEQQEEEEKLRNILFKMDLDMPKWKLDELFEEYNK